MTPKEKAEYLLNQMLSKNTNIQNGISMIDTIQAKLCAIVAVDEIISIVEYYDRRYISTMSNYWKEVKQEIEKL